jgi:phospholipase C
MSRRKFMKITAATATLGFGDVLGKASGSTENKGPGGLDRFDHVVVLMMENRSFDNLLGFLYEGEVVPNGKTFDGVYDKVLSNPIPEFARNNGQSVVHVSKGFVMDNPNPDPGEAYPHINTQLFNSVNPASNRFVDVDKMVAPFNLPTRRGQQWAPAPRMDGFVTDYVNRFVNLIGRLPTFDEYKIIMECFPPETVPVISRLAKKFAVCDQWHCAVPSQTFCNRSFFNAATSSGLVVNAPYIDWTQVNTAETIFNRLQAHGLTWKVYFDSQDFASLTAFIHLEPLSPYLKTNFCHMERFFQDVANGELPQYSFIEPRLFFNHNDEHPPFCTALPDLPPFCPPSSVLNGEVLINNVYNAIRLSSSPTGSNFANTLFVITFDEHGGTFDHVRPPRAVPPDPAKPAGQMGFTFDRLGVRVPTVLISAYIEEGTVINERLDHTSIIKTMTEKWGLGSLTQRDQASSDIGRAFTRSSPRPQSDWPVIDPRPVGLEPPPNNSFLNLPLNGLQRDYLELICAALHCPPHPGINTIGQALELIERTVAGLFGCS